MKQIGLQGITKRNRQPLPEKKAAACKVLIETLWNVNEEDSLRFYYLGNSFNRNIFGM